MNTLLPPVLLRSFLAAGLLLWASVAHAFDHDYGAWNKLLGKYVAWNAKGVASSVDYAGFARDRAALKKVLGEFSAISQAQYDKFSRDEKLAFLINAYNAFTVELILSKYPNLTSIKDLGSLFRSPWRKKFFTLLGDKRTLDWVEHEKIRAAGVFDEPRIHFVVNCASIGCPALRPEAMRAAKLEQQLADSTKRFFSDRSRNRYDAASGTLKVTKLFDWYGGDFTKGYKGIKSVKSFLAKYADVLADKPADRDRIKSGKVPFDYLSYDWALNKR